MKKILLITIFSITIGKSYCQESNHAKQFYDDSLRHELLVAKADTTRYKILKNLTFRYVRRSPDSVLHYMPLAFNLAEKLGYKKDESELYFSASISYSALGNLSKAVEADLKGLHIAEQTKNFGSYADILLALGTYYSQAKDYETALAYYKKAINEFEKLADERLVILTTNYIGLNYLQAGKFDSAEAYNNRAFQKWNDNYKKNKRSYGFAPQIISTHAEIETQKKNYGSAVKDLEEALSISQGNGLSSDLINAYLQLGRVFLKMNQVDSAAFYSRKSLSLSEDMIQYDNIADAAKLLAKIYTQKDPQQAIFYQEKALSAYDSATAQMKSSAVKNLVGFDEQQQKYEIETATAAYHNKVRQYALLAGLAVLLLIAFILFRNDRQKQKSNKVLQQTLSNLKSTQAQLIQSEKMASLGELTAGIAHEIQNPINFVNNFSEVNTELIDELKNELATGNQHLAIEIADDIKSNEEKISHHGKRADAIVKGMLQHSRQSSGKREPTDINALCDEYLRLSYQGMRAKDKEFNADFKTDFDKSIEKINIVPQDIGRVLLNIFNNAFYACAERSRSAVNIEKGENLNSYKPTVSVSTKKSENSVIITVSDNGNGIPDAIKEKIFQPFFTTKPTGSGTGLGLSLSYDIVKAHGGEIKVQSKEDEGSEFIITLPLTNKENFI